MSQVFLDTGFLIALELSDDQHHRAARRAWDHIRLTRPPLVTTSLVFVETVTLLQRRTSHAKTVEVGERLWDSPDCEIIPVDESLLEDGWRMLCLHSDKQWSLADCVSFIVMRRRSITQALAFDRHFEQAGFQRLVQ